MPMIDLVAIATNIYYFAKKAVYGLTLAAFVGIILAAFVSFVAAFFYFYNTVNDFIGYVNNYGGGDMLSKFFGLLNCIGFISALNDSKSLLTSSIVFLLARLVFAQVIYLYFILLRVIAPLVSR